MAIEIDAADGGASGNVGGSDRSMPDQFASRSMPDQFASLGDDFFRKVAEAERVCVRPLLTWVTDMATGASELVPIPCGSTQASRCPACADRARRLRMQQCREGWHLDEEPVVDDAEFEDRADAEGVVERRVRSTRRRQDVLELPRRPMEALMSSSGTRATGRFR